MSDPAPQSDRNNAVLRVLAVVFTVAVIGALVLVAVDLAVGRPPAGDVFIAALNSVVAVVLWRRLSRARHP